jgi:methylenetetrahydrofolate reductase (NADPH)
VAAEGATMCVETIQQLREIPGVAGVHVMAFGHERGIPEILERAGLAPAELVPAGSRPPDRSASAG